MAKIQVPQPIDVVNHINKQMVERNISRQMFLQAMRWSLTDPEVPNEQWWKRFDGFILCGKSGIFLTVLAPHMTTIGIEVK